MLEARHRLQKVALNGPEQFSKIRKRSVGPWSTQPPYTEMPLELGIAKELAEAGWPARGRGRMGQDSLSL